jgi:hypothetical protein
MIIRSHIENWFSVIVVSVSPLYSTLVVLWDCHGIRISMLQAHRFNSLLVRFSIGRSALHSSLSPPFLPSNQSPLFSHATQAVAKASSLTFLPQSSSSTKVNFTDEPIRFVCDEEPHMLPWQVGGGYIPLSIGQKLIMGDYNDEFTVVRKLG